MRGDGVLRAQERAFKSELKDAIRNHCHHTQAPDGHYDDCLNDLKHEPREGREWWLGEDWQFWLSFFGGEIK